MSVTGNRALQRLVSAKEVLHERVEYLNHKHRDIVKQIRTTPGKESRGAYIRQNSRVLQLASSSLEHAMILDGLIDSIVNIRILSDYKITATLNRLCTATIHQALDQVGQYTYIYPCIHLNLKRHVVYSTIVWKGCYIRLFIVNGISTSNLLVTIVCVYAAIGA